MITYLLQVSFCWISLYAIYYILLRRLTFFNTNRIYLLASLFIGLAIPLIGPYFETMGNAQNLVFYFESVQYTIVNAAPKAISTWDKPITYIKIIYYGGLSIVALKFFLGLYKIYQFYVTGEKEKKEKYTIVHTNAIHLPFSFFNNIFFSKNLSLNENVKEIILHEEVHINLWHSLDIIIVELLHIFFWFNPILVFYKKSLKASHEYTADKIILNHISKEAYSMLLIEQTTSGIELALSNQFFNSFIKNRITMMYKKQSSKLALITYTSALPIIFFLIYAFSSCKDNNDINESLTDVKIKNSITSPAIKDNVLSADTSETSWKEVSKGNEKEKKQAFNESKKWVKSSKTSDNFSKLEKIEVEDDKEILESEIFQVVDQKPEFPGGQEKLLQFLANNIKYPAEAREKGIEGNVVIRFAIMKDGSLSKIEVLRDVEGGCSEEAVRVVNSMNNMAQKWTPGKNGGKPVNVTYTLPIRFKLTS